MSIFLSRLVLDLRSRAARRDLGDVQELHRTVMRQFDSAAGNRASQRVLFRLEFLRGATPSLLIQSGAPPRWALEDDYLLRPPETKDITNALDAIKRDQRLRFRLRANPTRRPSGGDRRNAPRIPLTRWDDRMRWLLRKLQEAGTTPIEPTIDIAALPRDTGRTNGHRIAIWPVLFEGVLTVDDPRRVRNAIASGIGPARAYGNGLLSIAPHR